MGSIDNWNDGGGLGHGMTLGRTIVVVDVVAVSTDRVFSICGVAVRFNHKWYYHYFWVGSADSLL